MPFWTFLVRAEDNVYMMNMHSQDVEKPEPMELEVSSAFRPEGINGPKERDYSGAVAKTDEVEIRLVRKLDRRILPILCAMYFLLVKLVQKQPKELIRFRNYLDRNAIAQARLNELEKDLGMKGNQFNVAVSILFIGSVFRSFVIAIC